MDAILERSHQLQQDITDFVFDAEDELAQALETYAAEKSRRGSGDSFQKDFVIDSFITEGRVGDSSPLDLYVESQADLSESDRKLIKSWHHTFIGLFAVTKILPDGFELMNWLTAKHYTVKPNNTQIQKELSRVKDGEIILTRISPVTDTYWTFSGPQTLMGKLGKPKLAVAIGNFKDNYRNQLYGDAPELLEEAWLSVEQYHQQFVDFFERDEVTLPGYQLNKKIAEFQEVMTQKRLEAAGIDPSKSLEEIVQESGIEQEEIQAVAEELGADSKTVSQMFGSQNNSSKMVMPKVDLPAELKKAEQVTALSHPRWGQMFLPTYAKVQQILETEDWQSVEGAEKLIRFYLEDKSINTFIWHRLAERYPIQLEKVVQTVLQRPEFQLQENLNTLLQEFNKPIEPELPDIASVPIHLHNLFQEAVVEVSKSKPKGKGQKQSAKGFQRL
ncbi:MULTISPECIES: hypothetical protein [Nostocales]|uniref:Uncharacterized protein n=3 Tax=Nostocales TaxID=1161 RepID=A0A0C1R0D0_9CYAN|nr:hypothetical protein [Tolypothrix bouteillei]KAF3884958.1 hypothetical protein DA73_0400005400 [Tolypothrix bouteillei VB521301]